MKSLARWLGFATILALAVHFIFRLSLGWSMVGFFVGLPIVGLTVTAEDDLPGGWSNPDGKTPPPWSYREFWGEFVLRGALCGIGFAVDAMPEALHSAMWLAAALSGSIAGIAIIRSGACKEVAIDSQLFSQAPIAYGVGLPQTLDVIQRTSPSKRDKIMENPDTAHFRQARALDDKVRLHTVQMHFFRGTTQSGHWSSCGSGTLVKLGTRFFILTAGHCVRDAGTPTVDKIVVGIKQSAHRFEPSLERRGHLCAEGIDIGFFEVPPRDAAIIESSSRVFLSSNSLVITTETELRERNDWMIVGGYPDLLLEGDRAMSVGSKLLVYITTIAGIGNAPASGLSQPSQNGELDLWVPTTGNVDTHLSSQPPATVPELRGASGGGCWLARIRPHSKTPWSPSDIRLVGTHIGSCDPVSIGGKTHVFAREVLLTWHLALLAREYPDIGTLIERTWPGVLERTRIPSQAQ